ncbi:MAG: RluA family pseudouridine synthase [Chloroflexi bacterium]|nr:RluA family pseudouridine synthase [Chloroflexota bacterium]
MPRYEWRVDDAAERLDRYVATHCADLSRTQVQRLIREGRLTVNGSPTVASYLPLPGDEIVVDAPDVAPAVPQAEAIALTIVYEDADLLVIDKPAGLVVHPAPGHPTGTLVNAVLAYRPDVAAADLDPTRPGIVHRLDRDTSGLIVVATNRVAQAALQAQWKARSVDKRYLALVYGRLEPAEAVIDAPLGRDPRHRQRMAVVATGGRAARTSYWVREYLPKCSLVEAQIHSGRTHQIRVHLASLGHPVVGDRVYGPRKQAVAAPRQMLHAGRLTFRQPSTGVELELSAAAPADLQVLLEALRSG